MSENVIGESYAVRVIKEHEVFVSFNGSAYVLVITRKEDETDKEFYGVCKEAIKQANDNFKANDNFNK